MTTKRPGWFIDKSGSTDQIMKHFRRMISAYTSRFLLALAAGVLMAVSVYSQSISQEFPTPITASEVSGSIKARDIGDSRFTTYYYALSGEQGDLFVNLVTRNFSGDIDIFTVNGLRPITKIVVYADYSENETGRAIYLRKPERLLLRIQGRTPNDDEATFRLKFAGSFVAMRAEDVPAGPDLPRVSQENSGGVRVNSVGTILPTPPKAAEPEPVLIKPEVDAVERLKTDAKTEKELAKTIGEKQPAAADPVAKEKKAETPPDSRRSARKLPPARRLPPAEMPKEEIAVEKGAERSAEERPDAEKNAENPGFRTLTDKRPIRTAKEPVEPKADPLASINLVIQFKDGNVLVRKMSEVTRFSVDKGVLVVVLKTGGTTRYPIVEVAKVTIE